MSAPANFGPAHVASIYRRALRLSLNWAVRRDVWRPVALSIRAQFDANKDVIERNKVKKLITEAEQLLAKYKHPDPYIPPQRPGGSKYERNAPPRIENRMFVLVTAFANREAMDGDY